MENEPIFKKVVCSFKTIASIILLSLVNKSSHLKYAQIKYHLQAETVRNCSKQICWWILECDFLTGGVVFMDLLVWTCILPRSDSLKLKHPNDGFIYYKHAVLTSQDINWWTGVV